MHDAERMVREFHEKHSFPTAETFPNPAETSRMGGGTAFLSNASRLLSDMSRHALEMVGVSNEVTRLVRAHLMLEEMAETLGAMADGDEVEFADGLADLLYVTIGTAVAYDVPIARVFAEVHRSNMTKDVRTPDDVRLERKGQNFVPPAIAGVLSLHRHARRELQG